MRKQIITIALGQMVLDTVIHDHYDSPLSQNQNTLTLGGPPSFAGIIGSILSKIFSWMSPPLIYAYTCPKAISLLKNFPDVDLISKNLKIRPKCPQFRLIYSDDKKERILFLKNPPPAFNPTYFNWKFLSLPVAIVGSVYQEFNDPEIFSFLRDRCSYVAFDPQGCFRGLTSENRITFSNWWNPKIINYVDCLKVSEMEAKFLNLGNFPIEIVTKILKTSVSSILLTRGRNGAILGFKKESLEKIYVYNVPAYIEGTIADETGAGDVFLFMFVTHFQTFNNELDAIAFATSVTSLLLEQKGIMRHFSKEEIHLRQEKIKSQITEFSR